MERENVMFRSKLLKTVVITSFMALVMTGCGDQQNDSKKSDEESISSESISSELSGSETISSETKSDKNVSELAKSIVEGKSEVAFAEMTDSYVEGVMSIDLSKVAEYAVYVDASGTSVDEFGIFKANDGESEEVEKMIKDYLDMRLDTWMDEYMPEEKPKVQNAKITKKDNYYIYTILGESAAQEAVSTFESALGGE